MAFSQQYINEQLGRFLSTQEAELNNKIIEFSAKTEPPSQQEMLQFQLNMQGYTFMGQFASSIQKELHDAVRSIISKL